MSTQILTCSFLLCLYFLSQTEAKICAGCPLEFTPSENGEENQMLQSALLEINENSSDSLKLERIVKATKQVVNGVKYTFEVEVSQNDGPNNVVPCTIVLLLQPVGPSKPQILSQTCSSSSRINRQFFGEKKDIDKNEKEMVEELANYAVKILDDIDSDNHKTYVEQIPSAKKQLVNGEIMYHLELKVKETECPENDEEKAPNNCLENGVRKTCSIQLHRSFVEDSPFKVKVVSSNCEEEQKLGGLRLVQPNDESLEHVYKFAIDHINKMTNSMYVSVLDKAVDVRTQIVAGMKYFLNLKVGETECLKNLYKEGDDCKLVPSEHSTYCNVVVWEKQWENFIEILSSDCRNMPLKRLKRFPADVVTGGMEDLDLNDPSVKDLTSFALLEMDKETNSNKRLGIGKITSAKVQIVSGRKVTIETTVGESLCEKSDPPSNSPCDSQNPTQKCTFEIWEQSWKNITKLMESKCEPIRSKRSAENPPDVGLPGGVNNLNINDAVVADLLHFSLQEMDKETNSANRLGFEKIISATTQVVSGRKVTIKATVGESSCLKSEPSPNSPCLSSNPTKVCTFDVWQQLWKNLTKLLESKCEPIRSKREAGVLGGLNDVDPNDPQVTSFIPLIENELTNRLNSPYTQKVIKVKSVSSQTVAGKLYQLKIVISDSDCKKEVGRDIASCKPVERGQQICDVKIWKKGWDSTKMTESDCHKEEGNV